MRIAVQGVGLVSCVGNDDSDINSIYNREGLSDKKSPDLISDEGKNDFLYQADTSDLSSYIPSKKLRRIDHYSRMALLAAGKALEDAPSDLFEKDRLGVVVATGYGALKTTFSFIDSYIEKGDKLASPKNFSNSVHNAATAYISILFGVTGPTLTVSQFDMSFFSALITASVWLKEGYTDAVLVGSSDESCDVMGYCIQGFAKENNRLGAEDSKPGEGAAFFLLTREQENQKAAYGYIDDISIGNAQKSEIEIPDESHVIVSPGILDTCDSRLIDTISSSTAGLDVSIHHHATFPTDTAFDAAFALNSDKKDTLCFIKGGERNEYGKFTFSRH